MECYAVTASVANSESELFFMNMREAMLQGNLGPPLAAL